MQPGGHRFEPGILHQIFRSEARPQTSLTTEYPANGSFFRPHILLLEHASAKAEHAVCMKLMRWVLLRKHAKHQLEFLMVKLLRVYGECLGIKSR